MSVSQVLLLTNGGIRSLVTTAMVLSWPEPTAVMLLHVNRVQPARDARLAMVRKQAAKYSKCRLVELLEPQPVTQPATPAKAGRGSDTPTASNAATAPAMSNNNAPPIIAPLPVMRLLTAAMMQAAVHLATRILWPVSFNGDFTEITRAMEQTVLARHLASVEMISPPVIECPVMDMTSRQIIELGTQLNVPWELSWSCHRDGEEHCQQCAGCRRRAMAFDAAGVDDPCAKLAGVRGHA